MNLEIEGKRALVTGSSRGTGAAIARALAREGATVLVHGTAPEDSEEVTKLICDEGGTAQGLSGDVATDAGALGIAEQVERSTGGVDILVNNYGGASGGRWDNTEPADWLAIYERNTLSAVRMIRAFADGMKRRGWGRIVQIATIGVTRPGPRMPHYYASKAAMANLTTSLAKDLSGTGITVNTVSPGLIKTAEIEKWFRHLASERGWGESWEDIEKKGIAAMMPNPLERMARPDEVADLVSFVVSERARYVNGAHLRVDGGASAC